ncbi:MAG TPA: TonB-dependent receptor [Steroidobacteraceae bacterium]|nr:TonB-dependent receptor [Steroidobacteraceae bacterium]
MRTNVSVDRSVRGTAAVALALIVCIAAQAAEQPTLPTVVVTATRVAVPLEEVLAPVIVIDRDTIERSAANDAADLLRFHAGLDVARTGGPGQPTSVFIRGSDSNHTLVLVDGVRINPGTIGLPALQNVTPDMVERIEVVKGPRSALWGSDAIGGVVNVVTRRGSRDGWVVEAGYGDYDTRKASVNGGFNLGERTSLDFGVAWLDSDGFPTRTGDDTDRGYENLNGNVQLRTAVGAGELALQHWRAEGTSEYSDFFLTPVDQDYATSTTSASLRLPMAARGEARVAVAHMEDRIDQNQSADFLRTERDSVDAQFDWQATDVHALGIGAMHYSEDASTESYGSGFEEQTDSTSVYLQDRITTGPHLALLALGYTDHETAGSAFTWNAEYGYTFNGGRTRAFALAGAGFRAPDATDRYGYGGNPGLEPEQSRNYEIGLRHALTGRQTLEVSAFQTDIEDLIEYVVTDFETYEGQNRNVAEARIRGVEAAWRYAAEAWQVHVEAIYQDPRNRDDDSLLLRRAQESLTAGVTRAFGPVQLGLDVLATGERQDFGSPDPVTLDGYVLANLTAQWQATPSLALVARVENLLDEEYELASTYNTPDRGVYFTVRYAPAKPAALARTASSGRQQHQ